jgi:hypothetical protein
MAKKKVTFSDNRRQNIRGQYLQKAAGLIQVNYYYRDALRFTDMGAGKGYTKGTRITQDTYRETLLKGRKRKKILLKPLYQRINALMSQVSTHIISVAELDFASNIK